MNIPTNSPNSIEIPLDEIQDAVTLSPGKGLVLTDKATIEMYRLIEKCGPTRLMSF